MLMRNRASKRMEKDGGLASTSLTTEIRMKVGLDMRVMFGSYQWSNEHFWTQAEVERECEDLAEQLAALR